MKTIHTPPAWILARPKAHVRVAALVLVLLLASASAGFAQTVTPPAGGPYVMTRQVVSAGGERSSGGNYVLNATVGQATADPEAASGGAYRLRGGFHIATQPLAEELFANGFED